MPGHRCTPGNHAVICLVGVEVHVFPDLPLLLGEFLRRWDSSHPVLDSRLLCIHLLDQYLQLFLAFLAGVGVDAFGMLCAILRPGGGIAALEEVVIEFVDAAGSGLSGASHDWLEVGKGVLCYLRSVLRHFIAQPTVNLSRGLTEHISGDVGVDIQRGRCRHMAQHSGEDFGVHSVFKSHGGESMPLRYNYDKPEKPRTSRVFGYLARFFILFQTEKSSREVVIS